MIAGKLQMTQRWIIQYNFYLHDARWGRMFVRLCPYFPFTARVCLNQHHWPAVRMRQEIDRLSAMHPCLSEIRQPEASSGTGRLAHRQGSADLRSKVAGLLHSVLL